MKKTKRYQDCNLIIKLYRRLKYQPYYFLKAMVYAIIQTITKRNRDENGIYKASFIFSLIYCEWQMKADWHYTHEEVFGDIIKENEIKKNMIN